MGNRRYRPVLAIAGVMVACLMMGAACTKMQEANPVGEGCTALQGAKVDVSLCAYATYGTMNIFVGEAVSIADELDKRARNTTDAAASQKYIDARDALLKIESKSQDVQNSLLAAIRQVEKVRREVADSDGTKAEQLLQATANLNRWLTEAGPLLTDLISSVRGVSGT